jgi:predicted nucleotidyltransferase
VLTDADIDRIVTRLVRRLSPLAVGVFGSYATGAAKAASDLDVVIFVDVTARAGDPRRPVVAALRGVFHPVDAHVFTPEDFEAEATQRLSFAWIIARQVQLRYVAPGVMARLPSIAAAGA